MTVETLQLSEAQQQQIMLKLTEFTDRFTVWADEHCAGDEDARITCNQFARDMMKIARSNLRGNANLAKYDIAFPGSEYKEVTRYLSEQLTAPGETLSYEHDGIQETFVRTEFDGLWLLQHPTIRPHIVGSFFIPSEAQSSQQ